MYSVRMQFLPDVVDGHIDLSFRKPETWGSLSHPGVTGARSTTIMMGDPDAGPLISLAWFPPIEEDMARGWAHGHDSDNWRITLLGESHMGRESYGAGEFRFQNGGQPYGNDDYAGGPEGGYHLVMFGDRRGFPVRPVKQDYRAQAAEMAERGAAGLGITILDPYPAEEQGVQTNLGTPDKAGKVEGTFAEAASWPELVRGVTIAAGLVGESERGPVILLLQAKAGATARPACTFATEVLHMIVKGSCTIGADALRLGDVRLQEADAPSPAIVAGPDGLSLVLVVGDRREIQPEVEAPEEAMAWVGAVDLLVSGLARQHAVA